MEKDNQVSGYAINQIEESIDDYYLHHAMDNAQYNEDAMKFFHH